MSCRRLHKEKILSSAAPDDLNFESQQSNYGVQKQAQCQNNVAQLNLTSVKYISDRNTCILMAI